MSLKKFMKSNWFLILGLIFFIAIFSYVSFTSQFFYYLLVSGAGMLTFILMMLIDYLKNKKKYRKTS